MIKMDMTKIDKRKKYFIVFDSETTSFAPQGGLGFPLIYDFAYAITDKEGNIYKKENFIIKEIFHNKLMENAYYAKKKPLYDEMLRSGKVQSISFAKAMYTMNKDMKNFPNITFCAYNLNFDLRALRSTAQYTKLAWYEKPETNSLFWKEVEYQDLWGMAVETIYVPQEGFKKFIVEHDLYTPKGNPMTSAEVGFKYLTLDKDFVEDHMALSDVLIEVQLLAHSLKQKKKYTRGILANPFRLMFPWKKVA